MHRLVDAARAALLAGRSPLDLPDYAGLLAAG
jgi:hypothetical protein